VSLGRNRNKQKVRTQSRYGLLFISRFVIWKYRLDKTATLSFGNRVCTVAHSHNVEYVPELTFYGGRAKEQIVGYGFGRFTGCDHLQNFGLTFR
jgi:hypothetical protein